MVTKKPNSNSTVYDGSFERESLYKELLNFHIKLDISHENHETFLSLHMACIY